MFKNYWINKQNKIEEERNNKPKLSPIEYYVNFFENVNTIDDVKSLLACHGMLIEYRDNMGKNIIVETERYEFKNKMHTNLIFNKKYDDYMMFYLLHTLYHALVHEKTEYIKTNKLENADVFAILLLEKIRPVNYDIYIPKFVLKKIKEYK